METRIIYGINGNNEVTFLSLDAAENYLFDNNPEYCTCKDAMIDFAERMIWEEKVKIGINHE